MRQKKYGRLAIDPETHQTIRVLAAQEGATMKTLTERLLRLGMLAPELAWLIDHVGYCWDAQGDPMCPWCDERHWTSGRIKNDEDCPASAALAAYEAALNEKETP